MVYNRFDLIRRETCAESAIVKLFSYGRTETVISTEDRKGLIDAVASLQYLESLALAAHMEVPHLPEDHAEDLRAQRESRSKGRDGVPITYTRDDQDPTSAQLFDFYSVEFSDWISRRM
ncbi:hypothetical protein DXG01_009981 [Tephrocybe rancida]|nr:hypothetical protein DXG01_009981 [Tephrocybe rancida]